jgi:hypothetical protein
MKCDVCKKEWHIPSEEDLIIVQSEGISYDCCSLKCGENVPVAVNCSVCGKPMGLGDPRAKHSHEKCLLKYVQEGACGKCSNQ